MKDWGDGSHSAEVQLDLVVKNQWHPCCRSGPGYCELRYPEMLDASLGEEAEMVVTVDGNANRQKVIVTRLPTADRHVYFRRIKA